MRLPPSQRVHSNQARLRSHAAHLPLKTPPLRLHPRHRLRRRPPLQRRQHRLLRLQSRRHISDANNLLPAFRHRHPLQRHLPGPNRDRHDGAAVRGRAGQEQ